MGDRPLISILTATLNNLPGLRATAESVAAQTFRDLEHIVVDGGSTDGTVEWLKSTDLPIKWISEPDEGIADALNKGMKVADGEWILVLHAEDTFADKESLSRVIPHLSTVTSIVSSDVLFVTDRGERRWRSRGWTWKSNFKTTIPHQGALVHRSVFEQVGDFDPNLKVCMDFDFFLKARSRGVSVVTTGAVLARMPGTGVSSRRDRTSLSARFAEERSVHDAHAGSRLWRVIYAAYWPLYRAYRFVRHGITDMQQ